MMQRSLSVGFLTSARSWRGSGVSLASIAHGLAERGHHVHMLAGESTVVDAFSGLGLQATQVATTNTGFREVATLARALRTHRIDILMVDRPRDLRLGALASLSHPAVIVNRYNLSRHNPPPDLVSRMAYWKVALTIFLSNTTAERALRLAPHIRRRPYRVIPAAVDTNRFRPTPSDGMKFRAAYGLGHQPFVLAVGSLTGDKRYEFMFQALARLASPPPLVVCGVGPLAGELSARARELHLDVRFLGLRATEELPGAYSAASCFVHACAIETFGLSVLEAMACGCTVIAVRGGAVPEVLGDTGRLAPPEDTSAYAGLIEQVLADPNLRTTLGHAARLRAAEAFSLPVMRGQYSEAVESACLEASPYRVTTPWRASSF
jgi:glycosyltransferase involved in cell wall biosynthesis